MKEYDEFKEAQTVGRQVVLDNGIEYVVGKLGKGETCGEGKKVTINYELHTDQGGLLPGTMIDASLSEVKVTLGTGKLLEGWEILLADMKKGEQRNARIPPNLAWGESGQPPPRPKVGPNEWIMLNIELVDYE